MAARIARMIGDSNVRNFNKHLKPGQSPATIDTLWGQKPEFLKLYRSADTKGSLIGAASVPATNPEDVRKRLAAQLGAATIIGGTSSSLGG